MHIQRVINSKSEYRNPKQIQISNVQINQTCVRDLIIPTFAPIFDHLNRNSERIPRGFCLRQCYACRGVSERI
jgi:hypothetical protein